MEWDHLFADLEGQLAAEWEAERAALDAESERLRISRLTMRDRLRSMAAAAARISLELADGSRWDCTLRATGADWAGVALPADPRLRIVPLTSDAAIDVDHGTLLSSLDEDAAGDGSSLRSRMTFGFVLRDLARRRTPVTVGHRGADPQHGSIDRAGADHLDLALHDPGEPRRSRAVRGFRVIPFDAVVWVRVESGRTAAS
ncbi:hypothetical protein Q9R19_04095 [Microbacterium sp. ARD32]|uniref:hypothetical protein n=1 Tax=Microbacterium sp. ARD32 TaxID=2962577 RepID=UPI002880D0AB|nr:hypothetical protein [Microbacterium sp. ARD32]MDT0156804.1 hypothetical protein [Microbacterium sp. ARD32]